MDCSCKEGFANAHASKRLWQAIVTKFRHRCPADGARRLLPFNHQHVAGEAPGAWQGCGHVVGAVSKRAHRRVAVELLGGDAQLGLGVGGDGRLGVEARLVVGEDATISRQ